MGRGWGAPAAHLGGGRHGKILPNWGHYLRNYDIRYETWDIVFHIRIQFKMQELDASLTARWLQNCQI